MATNEFSRKAELFNEGEYEYESVSDEETEQNVEEEVEQVAPVKQVNTEPPKKEKKPIKENDKRKISSAENLKKAREARLARIRAQKEAATNQYEIESSSDDETEIVLTKQKKPVLVTKQEAKMRELELQLARTNLMLEKIAVQHKKKKVIQINPAPIPPEQAQLDKALKKKYLNL